MKQATDTVNTLSGTWDFKWDAGTTINVQFKRSPLLPETALSQQALAQRMEEIMAVANTWVENTSLQLNFSKPLFQPSTGSTTDHQAATAYDLLVELAPWGERPWSLLGQHAQRADYGESTMKLAIPGEDDTSSEANEQFKHMILHEFGHALGLPHEHQNPTLAIGWKKDGQIFDLMVETTQSGANPPFSTKEIRTDMTAPWQATRPNPSDPNILYSDWRHWPKPKPNEISLLDSVMTLPNLADLTEAQDNKFPYRSELFTQLTDSDKTHIAKMYPKLA